MKLTRTQLRRLIIKNLIMEDRRRLYELTRSAISQEDKAAIADLKKKLTTSERKQITKNLKRSSSEWIEKVMTSDREKDKLRQRYVHVLASHGKGKVKHAANAAMVKWVYNKGKSADDIGKEGQLKGLEHSMSSEKYAKLKKAQKSADKKTSRMANVAINKARKEMLAKKKAEKERKASTIQKQREREEYDNWNPSWGDIWDYVKTTSIPMKGEVANFVISLTPIGTLFDIKNLTSAIVHGGPAEMLTALIGFLPGVPQGTTSRELTSNMIEQAIKRLSQALVEEGFPVTKAQRAAVAHKELMQQVNAYSKERKGDKKQKAIASERLKRLKGIADELAT